MELSSRRTPKRIEGAIYPVASHESCTLNFRQYGGRTLRRMARKAWIKGRDINQITEPSLSIRASPVRAVSRRRISSIAKPVE